MKKIKQTNKNTKFYWNTVYDRQIGRGNFKIQRTLNKKVREEITGTSVLDIGCGNGLFVNYCRQFNLKAKGIDHSDRMVKYCCNRYGKHFKAADITKLNLKEESIDTITCLEVLEHLDDPISLVNKMRTWCKKQVIITVPNGDSIKSPEHVWSFEAADFEEHGFEVYEFNRGSRLLCIYNVDSAL